MEWIGIELDPKRNRAGADVISSDRSRQDPAEARVA
jgi:hypothetical protein